MHPSAFDHMAWCVDEHVPRMGSLRVVDLGSRQVKGQSLSHRALFDRVGCEYIGVDVVPGPNVDLVMAKPYRLPLRSNSVDVVVSGQAFEHIPFVWVSITEIARVLRRGGHALIVVPSRGHAHGGQDCWRFYPDGMSALAAWSGLQLQEVSTDFPPLLDGTHRHDYAAIDPTAYWGDTVGVFLKPANYPRLRMAAIRPLLTAWGNHLRGIEPGRRPESTSKTEVNSSR